MQKMWIQSLGWEDPLEKEMATHSSILAWEIPWMEEPGGLQSMDLQRIRHDLATKKTHTKSIRSWSKEYFCPGKSYLLSGQQETELIFFGI